MAVRNRTSRKRHVRAEDAEFVRHPRYGALPHNSGIHVSKAEIRSSFWSLREDEMFPESVLLADPAKQNYGAIPRKYYVDVRRQCRTCNRPFIFFAKEQRYWYEHLKFFVDADCVHCPSCRRDAQHARRCVRRYTDLSAQKTLSDDDLDTLVSAALFLFTQGSLKNISTLGALKTRALKQIPHHQSTRALHQALIAAHSSQPAQ